MALLIPVRHEDDVLAVIDRVLAVSDDEIVLEVPGGARILSSEENFALLTREISASQKRFALRTEDPRARALAARAGIPLVSGPAPSQRRFSDILPPKAQATASAETTEYSGAAGLRPAEAPTTVGAKAGDGAAEAGPVNEEEEDLSAAARFPERDVEENDDLVSALRLDRKVVAPARRFRKILPRIRLPRAVPRVLSRRGLSGIVLGLGLLVAFLVVVEILPSLELTVHPKSETVAFAIPIIVAVDGEESVRGQRVRVDASEERSVPASGKVDVTSRAKGTITVTNAYSSASQTIVANTRFISQDGKLFRLDQTTVIPGANIENGEIAPSSIDVAVTADEPGPDYNIGSSAFSIPGFQGTPKYAKFTARSREPMRGGARGTTAVVTADDIAKAKEGLADAVATKLRRSFEERIPEGLIVLEESAVDAVAVVLDAEEGAQAEQVVARAEGHRSAIAYSDQELREAVQSALNERVSDATDIISGSLTIAPRVKNRDIEKGTLALEVSVEARVAWRIDAEAVRKGIAGKREGEIDRWLREQDAIERTDLRFRPFWVSSAPQNLDRITVRVKINGKQ